MIRVDYRGMESPPIKRSPGGSLPGEIYENLVLKMGLWLFRRLKLYFENLVYLYGIKCEINFEGEVDSYL